MGRVRYKRLGTPAGTPGAGSPPRDDFELLPDGRVTLDEIRRMILAGELGLTDFVDFGRGWQSVVAAEELSETVDRYRSIRATRALLIAFIAVTILGILGAAWAMLRGLRA